MIQCQRTGAKCVVGLTVTTIHSIKRRLQSEEFGVYSRITGKNTQKLHKYGSISKEKARHWNYFFQMFFQNIPTNPIISKNFYDVITLELYKYSL